jgi:hypothetical protein
MPKSRGIGEVGIEVREQKISLDLPLNSATFPQRQRAHFFILQLPEREDWASFLKKI